MRKTLFQLGVRSLFFVTFLVTVMGFGATHVSAASSPLGIWNVNANGYKGTLQISHLGSDGTIYGAVLGSYLIGNYNASTGAISFLREIKTDFSYYQIYTGTLVGNALSGNFDEFYGGLTAHSNPTLYQWSATLSQSLANSPLHSANESYSGWANGHYFNLDDYADPYGSLTGTIFGNPILGYESTSAFNFVRVINSDFSYFQIYIGSPYMSYCGGAPVHEIGGSFAEVHGPTNGYSGPPYSWSGQLDSDPCI